MRTKESPAGLEALQDCQNRPKRFAAPKAGWKIRFLKNYCPLITLIYCAENRKRPCTGLTHMPRGRVHCLSI